MHRKGSTRRRSSYRRKKQKNVVENIKQNEIPPDGYSNNKVAACNGHCSNVERTPNKKIDACNGHCNNSKSLPNKDIQTKFNLFVSKLCLNSDATKYLFLDEYKQKMSHILTSAPDISLFKDEEIPSHLREVAILTGYRSPSSSVKECALSVFIATNETLNFWTHFIPTFYFVYQLISLWDDLNVASDSYYWPFAVYMFTICLYPLISALAHTFCTTSDMARHVWFFLDYGGLSLYSFGAGLLIKAYSFPIELQSIFLGRYYLEILVFLAIICSVSACFSRFLENLFWIKVFRLGAFFLPWIWDSVPVIYRLNFSDDITLEVAEHYNLQFFFSFCIGFFYASHIPEIFSPGKFDIIGNSHQLLHISGIMATHHQMTAVIKDMTLRREMMQANYPVPEYWSIHVFFLVFFSISVTIVIFILFARHYEKNKLEEKLVKQNN